MGSGASSEVNALLVAASSEDVTASCCQLSQVSKEKLVLALKEFEEPAASTGTTIQGIAINTESPPLAKSTSSVLGRRLSRMSTSSLGSKKEKPPLEKFHSAIRWGKKPEELISLLSDLGLTFENLVNSPDERNGNQSLHIAAQNGHTSLVRFLLSQGADANGQNAKGQTPLHMSVEYDFYFQSKVLLAAGAEKEKTNMDGNQAILGIEGTKITPDAWDSPMNIFKAAGDDRDELEEGFVALEKAPPELIDRAGLVLAGKQKAESCTSVWDEKRFQNILANFLKQSHHGNCSPPDELIGA